MVERDSLGEFEHIVLLAIFRLRENAYGVSVFKEIEKRTGRTPSMGALYTTLERLEEKGYVSSWLGEPTPERGGKAKRYFKIKAPGITAVNESWKVLASMRKGLPKPKLGSL